MFRGPSHRGLVTLSRSRNKDLFILFMVLALAWYNNLIKVEFLIEKSLGMVQYSGYFDCRFLLMVCFLIVLEQKYDFSYQEYNGARDFQLQYAR